jgi:hypothetical protein
MTIDYSSLQPWLMGHSTSHHKTDHFDVLNHHLRLGLLGGLGAALARRACGLVLGGKILEIDGDLIFQPEGA